MHIASIPLTAFAIQDLLIPVCLEASAIDLYSLIMTSSTNSIGDILDKEYSTG
jgi:hypothetical protein